MAIARRDLRRRSKQRNRDQTACKPGSVRRSQRGMAIHLGRPLPDASRDRPGRRRGNPPAPKGYRPYLVLLPVGFAVPVLLPGPRCALTAPFHPYRRGRSPEPAVCFLWHFPWGRPRRPLAGTVLPWSPDFPPPPRFPTTKAAIRPSGSGGKIGPDGPLVKCGPPRLLAGRPETIKMKRKIAATSFWRETGSSGFVR
jgi:hypothetical protein